MTLSDITPKKIAGGQVDAESTPKKIAKGKDSDESSDDSGDGDQVAPMAAALGIEVDRTPQKKEAKTPTELVDEADHLLGVAHRLGPEDFQDPSRCKAPDRLFDKVSAALIKDLKGQLAPLRKNNQLVIVGSRQKRILQLEGMKSVFVKTRALRLKSSDANRKGFEKALQDCLVKNELKLSDMCLISRSFLAELTLMNTLSANTSFSSSLATLSVEKIASAQLVDMQ